MNIKSIMHRLAGTLLALPLLPGLAHAFQMAPAHRSSYNGMAPHEHWQEVFHETMVDITVIGLIYSAVCLWFLIAYRRKGHGERGKLPRLSAQAKIGWVVIPVALFLADDLFLFVKGWDLHNHYREVPQNAYEVKVTGQMWSWTYEYPNGVETYDELRVPVGTPVVFRMHSEDVVHSHYLNRFHVTEDLMPGRVTYQWILPTEEDLGEHVVTCREYCGAGHSKMFGKVIVMPKGEFDSWLASESADASDVGDKVTDVAAATAPESKS